MAKVIKKTVYSFAELTGSAKERALQYLREWATDDSWWYESMLEDFADVAGLFGFELNETGRRKAIHFSGFWSQGDGASFDATYRGRLGAFDRVKQHAPMDEKLHAIARELDSAFRDVYRALGRYVPDDMRAHFRREVLEYGLRGLHTERNSYATHYCHENTRQISGRLELADDTDYFGWVTWRSAEDSAIKEAADNYTAAVESARYDLCRWLYRTLETEYYHQTSEETLAEMAAANDLFFDEKGECA